MNSKRKIKKNDSTINDEDYINSNDIESSKFIRPNAINENNTIQNKYYKKLLQICLFSVVIIKILYVVSYKYNYNYKNILNKGIIFKENINNQSLININMNASEIKYENNTWENRTVAKDTIIYRNEGIQNETIKNETMKEQNITNNEIIKDNNITNETIKDQNIVNNEKIKDRNITNNEAIKDHNITNNENIKDNNITNNETIKDNNIINNKTIKDNNITNDETIKGNNITNNETIKDNNITNNETINNTNISDILNIPEYKPDYVTNDKIYWKNNTSGVDFKKINDEIYSLINITPSFKNREELYKRDNPKVSLIIPVYNQERFVKKIYGCIEKQSLKDIEIIFIDDCSPDNSSQIIKELMEIDKRIVYLKNDKNVGVYHSRNNGVLAAKGEYIHCTDIDDYLLNDILIKAYVTAKTYNLDVLQFYVMAGDLRKNMLWGTKYRSGIIRGHDEVKKAYFNTNGRNTWDKLIKREAFIKSINFMKEKFRSDRFAVFNDDVACFGLFKTAESYGFLEEMGYIYNWDVQGSETHRYKDISLANPIYKSCFTIMEYFYEQTDNDTEKNAAYGFYTGKAKRVLRYLLDYLTEGFDYIFKVIDIFLNSEYFKEYQKNNMKALKESIMRQKERVGNNNKTNLNNTLL